MAVISGGDISGGVVNNGNINTGPSGVYNGIYVDEASISGGIENYGTIGGVVGIYMDGSTSSISNGIVNTGTINASMYGISIESGTVNGGVSNTGLIMSDTGVNVLEGGSIVAPTTGPNTGVAINNVGSGSILSTKTGVLVAGGQIDGDIVNSGVIANGESGMAIVEDGQVAGDIVNHSSGVIAGSEHGIVVASGSGVTGAINNAGRIAVNDPEGVAVLLAGDASVNSITNSAGGTIAGGDSGPFAGGVSVLFGSEVTEGITNAGDIYGMVGVGTAMGSNIGSINNQTGGEIYGDLAGIIVTAGSSVGTADIEGNPVGNAITNAVGGSIGVGHNIDDGTRLADIGIDVEGGAIIGNIDNSGLIVGERSGISFGGGSTMDGDIVNRGTIDGEAGIVVAQSSTIDGDIINEAGGAISGGTGPGIYISTSSDVTGTIINSGSIQAINPESADNAILIDGGTSGSDVGVTNKTGGDIEGNVTMGTGDYRAEGGTVEGNVTGHGGEFVFADGAAGASGVSGTVSGFGSIGIDADTTVTNNAGGLNLNGFADGEINIYDGTLVNQTGPALVRDIVVGSGVTNAGISNTGTISADISVMGGDLSGGLTNSGVINAGSTHTALYVDSSGDVSGGITNSGLITGYRAIVVDSSSSISGGIVNNIGGAIHGDSAGLFISNASTVTGGVTNHGTIGSYGTAPSNPARYGIVLREGSEINGGILNTGDIDANSTALFIDSSTVNGGITNSGTITSSVSMAVSVRGSSVGTITNAEGGMISGTSGIVIESGSVDGSSVTSIINAEGGMIRGTLDNGIDISGSGTTVGSITNAGTISGDDQGIYVSRQGSITGGINNSGRIEGDHAIRVDGTDIEGNPTTVAGGIMNQVGGEIDGDTAGIFVSNGGSITGGVTNYGDITGDRYGIRLSNDLEGIPLSSHTTGSSITGGINNALGATISATDTAISIDDGASITGGITNSGRIEAESGAAISIRDESTVDFITNAESGVIYTPDYNSATGIRVDSSSTVTGAITNYGTIDTEGVGIKIEDSSQVQGGIANHGTIDTEGASIVINRSSDVLNGITNSGLIRSEDDSGIVVDNESGISNASGYGINNSGTIDAYSTGIEIRDGSTVSGGINNTGTIFGDDRGIYVDTDSEGGVSSITGGIANAVSATISATNTAIKINDGSTVTGGITNSGNINAEEHAIYVDDESSVDFITNHGNIFITGSSSWDAAILIEDTATITGAITNNGTISAPSGDAAIRIASSSEVLGGIVNNGKIYGDDYAIDVEGSSVVTNGITNNASATISASSSAIRVASNSSVTGGITNSGDIISTDNDAIQLDTEGSVDFILNTESGLIDGYSAGIDMDDTSTVTGAITNHGDIIGESGGINIRNGSMVGNAESGGIINTGLISATTSGQGIDLEDGASVTGGITNSGTIQGYSTGIEIESASSVTGGITNSGKIIGMNSHGIKLESDIEGTPSTISGGINNLAGGTISGSSNAIWITNGSVVNGGITNSGLIKGSYGIYMDTEGGVILPPPPPPPPPASLAPEAALIGDPDPSELHGGIVNQVTGTISATNEAIKLDDGSILTGGITNHGTIVSSDNDAIEIDDGSTVDFITNAAGGDITAYSTGIQIDSGSRVTGAITNAGYIDAEVGIAVTSSSNVEGGIVNTNVGTISARFNGIYTSSSTVTGGIVNSGYINAESGINIDGRSIVDSVTNAAGGTINADIAIHIESGSTVTGAVSNHGTISDGSSGVVVSSTSDIEGGVINTGMIDVSSAGIRVTSSSDISGGINNSGTISGGHYGIYVTNTSDISGGVTNSGTIFGGDAGISVDDPSDISGGITNEDGGVIDGGAGRAIEVLATSDISGGVMNMAGGVITGSTAIYVDGTSDITGDIDNSGTINGNGGDAILIDNAAAGVNVVNNASGIINGDISMGAGDVTSAGMINGDVMMNDGTLTVDGGNIVGAITGGAAGTFNINADLSGATSVDGFGTMNVNMGNLMVAGDFGQTTTIGDVNVAAGANIEMNGGSFSSASITNSGTVTIPANETLDVTGDYTQVGDGTVNIGIDGTDHGQMTVGGNADLSANDSLQVSADNLPFAATTTYQDVIDATDVLSGDIMVDDLNDNVMYTFEAVEDADGNVDLIATLNEVETVLTPNASAPTLDVADAVDDLVDENMGDDEVGDLISALNDISDAGDREDAVDTLQSVMPGADLRMGEESIMNFAGIISGQIGVDIDPGNNLWVRPFGGSDRQKTRLGVDGFKSKDYGVAFGFDKDFDDMRVGIAASFAETTVDGEGSFTGGRLEVETKQIAGYARKNIGNAYIGVIAGYGDSDYESSRRIQVGSYAATAMGDYSGSQVHAKADMGHRFAFGDNGSFTPIVSLHYGKIDVDTYSETGAGNLSLTVLEHSLETLKASVGGRFVPTITGSDSSTITPYVEAHMSYDLLDNGVNVTSRFTSGTATFLSIGNDKSRWMGTVGAGLNIQTSENISINVGYNGDFASGYTSHNGQATFRVKF
ncbi:autotransporter domain-containing protein [Pseudemcibacter aquimaris]|uniref:autotransporter domain-containing protein n=1 Tax=Pseudemcibacter aquimaris TaxID=2857064 RepID=UPI0020116542|nr:autotransporter domain-containing protein [Pseudemcibacter aquimaris]MCC3862468.1 autotransporter domain-containing protein [Pseudemcibacter aquimaris]WDU59104.1 autotransporter domain-containing protein [Pseudemcibacter aquimaris]